MVQAVATVAALAMNGATEDGSGAAAASGGGSSGEEAAS
jgi:hypothetical protein